MIASQIACLYVTPTGWQCPWRALLFVSKHRPRLYWPGSHRWLTVRAREMRRLKRDHFSGPSRNAGRGCLPATIRHRKRDSPSGPLSLVPSVSCIRNTFTVLRFFPPDRGFSLVRGIYSKCSPGLRHRFISNCRNLRIHHRDRSHVRPPPVQLVPPVSVSS